MNYLFAFIVSLLFITLLAAETSPGSEAPLISGSRTLDESIAYLVRDEAIGNVSKLRSNQPLLVVLEKRFQTKTADRIVPVPAHPAKDENGKTIPWGFEAERYVPEPIEPERREVSVARHGNDLTKIGLELERVWPVKVEYLQDRNLLLAVEQDDSRTTSPLDVIIDPIDLAPEMTFLQVRRLLHDKYGMEDPFAKYPEMAKRWDPSKFLCDCADQIIWSEKGDAAPVTVRDLALAMLEEAAEFARENYYSSIVINLDGSTWYFGR